MTCLDGYGKVAVIFPASLRARDAEFLKLLDTRRLQRRRGHGVPEYS
jgi:hypothetical protein